MKERKSWSKGPETLLLERLFGDFTELGDEELDFLYAAIASRTDGAIKPAEVRSPSAHRHRVPENEEARQPDASISRSTRQTGSQKQCQPATAPQRGDGAEIPARGSIKPEATDRAAIYDGRVSRLLSRRKHQG